MIRLKSMVSAVLVVAVLSIGAIGHAADEAAASTFVLLKYQGTCDSENNRLWLQNSHSFKTVITKIRWKAAGGKDLTEEFYPAPNSSHEIGCAAEAEILEAKFADF